VHKVLRRGLFLAVAVIATAAGMHFHGSPRPVQPTDTATGALLRAEFIDLAGNSRQINQWKGRVLVVNFWATWCAPCREEIPALIKVQKRHDSKNLQIVGIALDNVDKVREYAAEMKIDYALLIGGADSLGLMKSAGNSAGVLPYSLVLDRAGKVVHMHAGALTEAALNEMLVPLI
jgi:thiol-disulfide isomerase/thioredoxin